jgi:hypothetical protein
VCEYHSYFVVVCRIHLYRVSRMQKVHYYYFRLLILTTPYPYPQSHHLTVVPPSLLADDLRKPSQPNSTKQSFHPNTRTHLKAKSSPKISYSLSLFIMTSTADPNDHHSFSPRQRNYKRGRGRRNKENSPNYGRRSTTRGLKKRSNGSQFRYIPYVFQ